MTGTDFRKWRRNLEITQQQVADYIDCNKSTICRWEKGDIQLLEYLNEKVSNYINIMDEIQTK